ncbi:MAG: hypothetical protein ACUVYA_12180 [Planctomycetota bacterium]
MILEDLDPLVTSHALLRRDPEALEASIDTGGEEFEIAEDRIEEDVHGPKPTRLGIRLRNPVERATVRISIRPAPEGSAPGGLPAGRIGATMRPVCEPRSVARRAAAPDHFAERDA